ncbi:uncharacterized protein LOC126376492 [Pectinophora gossypiella]|uniref:uncharacterized protein LOC126376492 n=1 Tax=Pectinophora gossypiella TaxID=13191 RepID=UPI00214E3E7A|nr:uncharacterized protein LOC126376492 [Pectinophora gossypiella]
MKVTAVLLLVTFGAVLADPVPEKPAQVSSIAAPELKTQDVFRAKRSYDRWLDIIAQFGRRGADGTPWQPISVDLPVTDKDGKSSSLPVLVLPIPVPVPDPKLNQECEANKRRGETDRYREDRYREENRYRQDKDRYTSDRNKHRGDSDRYRGDTDRYRGDSDRYRGDSDRYRGDSDRFRGDSDRYRGDGERYRVDTDRYREDRNRYRGESDKYRGDTGRYGVNEFISRTRGGYAAEERYEQRSSVSTDYLIELFRAQQPTAPELPPALIDYAPEITEPRALHQGSGSSSDQRKYLPPAREALPSPPKFDKSIKLQGFLTVPRADYTEPYTAWYDATSGAARVEYHEGGAMSVRTVSSDGRVKRSVMHTDRTTEQDIRVCGVTSPARMKAEDRAPPGLPDTEGFEFAGYREEFGGRVEVWRKEVSGRAGELGAARGESLTFRHELFVSRKSEEFSVPLKYKVAIDSSVLGKDSDGYEHIYSQVQEETHRPGTFDFPERDCDKKEELDANNVVHMARLEPLREFTLPHRDEHHDVEFDNFVKEFERNYDDKEAALRKTLLIESSRFIASCNRQSATFELGVNFLTDRLDAEIEVLLGAFFDDGSDKGGLTFPVGEGRLRSAEEKLPKEFDWRPRGGVTPVKFQGITCQSCWAFAVIGSVEGALFIKTSKLLELSEQCLVDCAHSHGAHGCNGTWPSHAFNYIKDKGIPARDEYTAYKGEVLKCREKEIPPVTHISGFVDVPPNSINALKVSIRRFAPTVVVVDAKPKSFYLYKKGVLQDDRCVKGPKKRLNHAVLAVGWGELRNAPHFILKNQWTANWGDGGYIKVHAPSNTCGHLTTPNFARLRKADIDRLPGGGESRAAPVDDDYEDEDER